MGMIFECVRKVTGKYKTIHILTFPTLHVIERSSGQTKGALTEEIDRFSAGFNVFD